MLTKTPGATYAVKLPLELYERVHVLKQRGFSVSGWLTKNLKSYVLQAMTQPHKLSHTHGLTGRQIALYLPVDLVLLLRPLRAQRKGSLPVIAALAANIDALEAQYNNNKGE